MTPFFRILRGLASLGLILVLVGGTPALLVRIGRWPTPAALPDSLLAPDNGVLLLVVLTVLGWVAWAGFTASVVLELVGLVRGRRLRVRLVGLGAPRSLAAGLLLSIVAMFPLGAAQAEPPGAEAPTATGPPSPAPAPIVQDRTVNDTVDEPEPLPGVHYTVQRGDDLWSIAERFYGDGLAWARIAAANPVIESPDHLEAGWDLVLPGLDEPNSTTSPPPAGPANAAVPLEDLPPEDVPPEDPPPEGPARATPAEGATATTIGAAAEPSDTIAYLTAGISSLTAAALLAILTTRRATQLAAREAGRRIIHPMAPGQHLESALGRTQDPVSLRTLDLALRALGRHYREAGRPLPGLRSALVAEDGIVIELDVLPDQPPAGFRVEGCSLRIRPGDEDQLAVRGGSLLAEPSPYPALVCLGETPGGALLLLDLESAGGLSLTGPTEAARGLLNSLALELSCSWWGRGQSVIVVDGDSELIRALDDPTLLASEDLAAVLDELEGESRLRHPVRADAHPRDLRVRPDLAEAWRPRVLLIGRPLTDDEQARIEALAQTGQAIVVAADPELAVPRLELTHTLTRVDGGDQFRAQIMTRPARDRLLALLRATATVETTPASWWSQDDPTDTAGESLPRHAHLPDAEPTRAYDDSSGAIILSLAARRAAHNSEEPAMDAHEPVLHPADVTQPTVLIVGPTDLVGARGERPARAGRQCVEYAAWLLEHPGATASMMATELLVAEGTRRSNMSRLRAWLGVADDGERFLPEAYSGRIQLHAAVTSDWNRMQLLTIGGVDRASEDNLRAVLELVRGAPLADAAPGQWHWAEELRTDISSLVRDAGLVLCERALTGGDIDLARWAVNRALVAAPEDERLLVARVRTEHRAGNRGEVERLALRLVRGARKLNVDLADETVTLLQEVMEGRSRERLG
ncbi:MAG: LysM peptidoglycan-binding domain-containing protein [Propionibacteriaceae bacterium]|nr:LysM peptidoglycan-binding domain-containing protein [Propionibacteriaceae bacterium]